MIKDKKIRIKYAGATKYLKYRMDKHQKKYNGTMIYADTENMRAAENRLLEECRERGPGGCKFNVHRRSNAKEQPGHVYIIV